LDRAENPEKRRAVARSSARDAARTGRENPGESRNTVGAGQHH
jgi:hypothetical protein